MLYQSSISFKFYSGLVYPTNIHTTVITLNIRTDMPEQTV